MGQGGLPTGAESSAFAGDFYIVGIGASAGGLEALEDFFQAAPLDSGMAYVVVQHLSRDFKSVMDELLRRRTAIPIRMIENGMVVVPNAVYLLPPKKEVILAGGKVLLTDRPPGNELSFPIDHFFRSLAHDAGQRAIAVILSGTGSDGSRGILDVHAAGGLVVVQGEQSAKFNGMPRSACDTGIVDLVLPPDEMAGALVDYRANPLNFKPETSMEVAQEMEGPMFTILNLLKKNHGIDFSHYKTTTIGRRIERRLMLNGGTELEAYADLLRTDLDELDRLYKDLLIGVTGFFRDTEVFERLESDIIPRLLDALEPEETFRAWVVGTATGEEAYSLAILLKEQIDHLQHRGGAKIFATDVHSDSLELASRGVYCEDRLTGVTARRLQRFFVLKGDAYHIAPELRKMVVFVPHNVFKDAPFTNLDLITCRNVLIYFTPQAQQKVLSLFHFGMKRGAALCLGSSETTGELSDEFEPIDERARIYCKHRDVSLPANMRMSITPPSPMVPSRPKLRGLGQVIPARDLVKTYDHLLDEFMPPSLLISDKRELLHTFSGAQQVLALPRRPALQRHPGIDSSRHSNFPFRGPATCQQRAATGQLFGHRLPGRRPGLAPQIDGPTVVSSGGSRLAADRD